MRCLAECDPVEEFPKYHSEQEQIPLRSAFPDGNACRNDTNNCAIDILPEAIAQRRHHPANRGTEG